MLVKIDPPLVGQQFGLGPKDVDMLVLAARLEGQTLFPVTEWPCPVYVRGPFLEALGGSAVAQTQDSVNQTPNVCSTNPDWRNDERTLDELGVPKRTTKSKRKR